MAFSAPSSGKWDGEVARLRKSELSANVKRIRKKREWKTLASNQEIIKVGALQKAILVTY